MKSQGPTLPLNQEIEKHTAKEVAACEEKIFPGQIVTVQKDGCLKSGSHGMWSKHEDILLYPFETVPPNKIEFRH